MLKFKTLFLQHTALTRNHLTPEILLRLVTPGCPLWSSRDSPFEDPFWAFYWPGGQATAREREMEDRSLRETRRGDVSHQGPKVSGNRMSHDEDS
ncbi:putative Ribosomal protein L11 methyltransferase, partial [Danaus plexippus plexippus]